MLRFFVGAGDHRLWVIGAMSQRDLSTSPRHGDDLADLQVEEVVHIRRFSVSRATMADGEGLGRGPHQGEKLRIQSNLVLKARPLDRIG